MCLKFGEFGIGSTHDSSLDILLYSHYWSACYCIDFVKRNSFLVTHWSNGLMCTITQQKVSLSANLATIKFIKLYFFSFYVWFCLQLFFIDWPA